MTDRTYRQKYGDIGTELDVIRGIYPTEVATINRLKMIHIAGLRILDDEKQFEEAVQFFDDTLIRMYDVHCRRALPNGDPG